MRIDTEFFGNRTTVRISPELWDVFVLCFGSDTHAKQEIRDFLASYSGNLVSPSKAAECFICGFLKAEIKSLQKGNKTLPLA